MAARSKTRHDLDDASLGKYLATQLPSLKLPVISAKIGYGQSNPTYFVDDAAGVRYILRKRPSGVIISPVAHQVDREFRVLDALGKVDFPVPKVYCLCEDASVIGTSFYVMEFVKGRIITDPDLGVLSPQDRRKAWFSMIETLAKLHSYDPDAIGLGTYGKGKNFYLRHTNTFSRIEAQQAKVKDKDTGKELGRAHENYDEMMSFVRKNVPGERKAIVHGDFKFDNVILHPTEPRVIAVLDWELSTIGHPLMDAVYVVAPYWFRPSEVYRPENQQQAGMPSMEELMAHYAKLSGYNAMEDKWKIAQMFHLLRGGTITHGIRARTISGQASSEFSHIYFEQSTRSFNGALEKMREIQAQQSKL